MKTRLTIAAALAAAVCLALSGCSDYKTVTADPAKVKAEQATAKQDEEEKTTDKAQEKKAAAAEETGDAAKEKDAGSTDTKGDGAKASADEKGKTGQKDNTPQTPSTATEPAEPEDTTIRSVLTNLEIDPEVKKQRPIAVMYPINWEAQPQYGLDKVDVFYEMIEEGTMSRQMGIIQDWQNLSLIGNIRSTRSYFVLEAMRYDPIMIHFGGPIDWLINVTSRKDLDNLNGVGGVLGGDYGAFYRIDNGKALEHTAFTDAESIKAACGLAGYQLKIRPEYYDERQFYFNAPDDRNTLKQYEDSIPATTIDMSGAFPVTQSYLAYNEEDHKYYKYLYGEPQCDGITGEQLAFDNVIIQEAKFKYVGNHGYVDLDTISRGRNAYVFTEGRCVPCYWWRKGVHKHTSYYYKDKSHIHLNTGKTMIFIVRDHLDTFAIDGVSYLTEGDPLTPVPAYEESYDETYSY